MTTLPQFGQPINRSQASGGGGGSDGWELIEDITVPADTTQVDITGLDGDTDALYRLIASFRASGGFCNVMLRFNNDSGASSYAWSRIRSTGTSVGAAQDADDSQIEANIAIADGEVGNLDVIIDPNTGQERPVQMCQGAVNDPATSFRLAIVFGLWLDTVSNMTEINLFAAVANAIGAGSRIWLFKKAQ